MGTVGKYAPTKSIQQMAYRKTEQKNQGDLGIIDFQIYNSSKLT